MNYPEREIEKKKKVYNCIKKNKVPQNKSNYESKRTVLRKT